MSVYCRYDDVLSGMSGMRGQRDSTGRYLMRCRLPFFAIGELQRQSSGQLYPVCLFRLIDHSFHILGYMDGESTWAILARR
jgi:hypothetical protein